MVIFLSRIIVFFTKQTLDQFPSLESSTLIYTFIDIIVDKFNKMGGSNKIDQKTMYLLIVVLHVIKSMCKQLFWVKKPYKHKIHTTTAKYERDRKREKEVYRW